MKERPPNADPNATVELDALDANAVELVDSVPPSDAEPRSKTRATPPPLPPPGTSPAEPALAAPPPPSLGQQTPAPSKTKPLVLGAIFVALLAVAIVAGLKVGSSGPAAPGASSTAQPPASQTAAASAAGPAVISIPTVELVEPAADAGK